MRGNLGGSASAPTGSLTLHLTDGAIGTTRLSRAAAKLAVTPAQSLTLNLELAPADAAGHVRLGGTVALPSSSTAVAAAQHQQQQRQQSAGNNGGASASMGGIDAPPLAPLLPVAGEEDAVDVVLSVTDGGMQLLTSLVPTLAWESGGASLAVRVAGSLAAPQLSGSAAFSRAVVHSAYLRAPITHLSGSLALDGSALAARDLEGRVGAKGHVRLHGSLPLRPLPAAAALAAASAAGGPLRGLELEASGLEVRVRAAYAGALDARVSVRGAASAPIIGGWVRFSRGTAYLLPQGVAATPAAEAAVTPPMGAAATAGGAAEAELVERAFSALKAGRLRAAAAASPQVRHAARQVTS